jgi:hypothetical protein
MKIIQNEHVEQDESYDFDVAVAAVYGCGCGIGPINSKVHSLLLYSIHLGAGDTYDTYI